MGKLQSRKLWATVLTGVIVIINSRLSLGLDQDTVNALAFLAAAYIVGQAWVDSKK